MTPQQSKSATSSTSQKGNQSPKKKEDNNNNNEISENGVTFDAKLNHDVKHLSPSSKQDGGGGTTLEDLEEIITIESSQTGSEWNLTWPIWHMLPRSERKDIASRYGMSIGEFEEYMSLQQAVESTAAEESSPQPPPMMPLSDNSNKGIGNTVAAKESSYSDDEDDDDDEEGNGDTTNATTKTDNINTHEGETGGGLPLLLPDELLHRILSYLHIESSSICALVHPTWASFTRTEQTYKGICERVYLRQAKKKMLNLSKWQNSYHYMLTHRPRVRTGGGLYVLKYAQVKKIQRDMWTEIPFGVVLETVYYRYVMFLEDGTVWYSLTPLAPHVMIPTFVKMRKLGYASSSPNNNNNHKQQPNNPHEEDGRDKRIHIGRYEVSKNYVRVWAEQSWCHVSLDMKILPSSSSEDSSMPFGSGKFCTLSFERHRTSSTGDFNDYWVQNNVVEFDVPPEPFCFLRDKRL